MHEMLLARAALHTVRELVKNYPELRKELERIEVELELLETTIADWPPRAVRRSDA